MDGSEVRSLVVIVSAEVLARALSFMSIEEHFFIRQKEPFLCNSRTNRSNFSVFWSSLNNRCRSDLGNLRKWWQISSRPKGIAFAFFGVGSPYEVHDYFDCSLDRLPVDPYYVDDHETMQNQLLIALNHGGTLFRGRVIIAGFQRSEQTLHQLPPLLRLREFKARY